MSTSITAQLKAMLRDMVKNGQTEASKLEASRQLIELLAVTNGRKSNKTKAKDADKPALFS